MSLYDISTASFIKYLSYSGSLENLKVARLLIDSHVRNYGELEELVDGGNPKFDIKLFREELSRIKEYAIRLSSRVLPKLYTFPTYQESGLDIELLNEVDANTSGSVLPFNSPYYFEGGRGFRLGDYTIQDLKTLLGLYSPNGTIALFAHASQMGSYKMRFLAELINFYEKQVLRIVREQGFVSCEESLFFVNHYEKLCLVEEHLSEMIEFLIDSASEYVWGPASDSLKGRLAHCSDDLEFMRASDKKARYKLIDYFANYSTLSELHDRELREKAVKRFIVKKKNTSH